jgi:hypothetical protein
MKNTARKRARELSAARSIVIAAIAPLKSALADEHITFEDIGIAESPSGQAAYCLSIIATKPVTAQVLSREPGRLIVKRGAVVEVCDGTDQAMRAISFFMKEPRA